MYVVLHWSRLEHIECGFGTREEAIDHAEKYLPWTVGPIGLSLLEPSVSHSDRKIEDITKEVWRLHDSKKEEKL